MNRPLVFTSAALVIALVAGCKSVVVGGGTGGGGGGGVGGAGGSSATVMTSSSSGVFGQPQAIVHSEKPGFVTLRITTFGATCANPGLSPPYSQCQWTDVRIRMPAEYLVPGTVDMKDPSVDLFVSESGTPNSPSPGDCPGSGAVSGGVGISTLAIQSVDDDEVTFVLGDLGVLMNPPVDGTYVAPRCDVAP